MNKIAWVGGAAALVVVGTGAGGYFYIDSQVRTAVETALTTTLPAHPAVQSITYDDYSLNLLDNRLSVQNLHLVMDMSAVTESVAKKHPGISIAGTMDLGYDEITAQGIRSLAFGSTTLSQIDFSSSSVEGVLIETLQNPDSVTVNNEEYVTPETPLKSATITISYKGTTGPGHARGVDLSDFMAEAGQPMALTLDHFDAQDMHIDASVETTIEQATTDATAPGAGPQNIPAFDMVLDAAKVVGKGFSPDYYGLVRYENVAMTFTPKDGSQPPSKMTMSEWSMRDTKLVDFQPVRTSLEIKDWVLDTPELKNPKAQAFMTMLGIDAINMDMKIRYDFDQDKKTLTVDPFRLGLKQAGTVDVGLRMEGMPDPGLFEKMSEFGDDQAKINAAMEEAFQDVALDELSVGYVDDGILKKFLASQAVRSGAEPAQLAKAYSAQAARFLGLAFGKDKAEDVRPVLETFLTDPDALRANLRAKLPLKLKDLMADIDVSGLRALSAYQLKVKSGKDAQLQ